MHGKHQPPSHFRRVERRRVERLEAAKWDMGKPKTQARARDILKAVQQANESQAVS